MTDDYLRNNFNMDNFHVTEMTQQDIVKSLKTELLSAETETKALKEELRKKEWLIQREREKSQARTNAYLDCLRTLTETKKEMKIWKKNVEVLQEGNAALNEMWNGLTSEKKQLEDEVQQKNEIIQREAEKTLVQTNAYMAYLGTLTVKEKELKSWMAQYDALQEGHLLELRQVEETCRKKLDVLHEENSALNEMWNGLTSEINQLVDEVQQKDEIIQREREQTRVQTHAYMACLGTLTVKEKELKSSNSQCDALQEGHLLELRQVEETCRKKLDVLHEENSALNEMWNGLTSEINQLVDEVQQKDEIIQREREQTRVQTHAYMACLGTLTVKEKELKSSNSQCDALQEGHLLELRQLSETCRKKLDVLHEENAALNEMWNGLTSEINQLVDEVQQKDEFIQRVTEQMRAQINAYISCLGTLTVKEKELPSVRPNVMHGRQTTNWSWFY